MVKLSTRTCRICGKEFSNVGIKNIYCSAACARISWGSGVIRTCEICGLAFRAAPNEVAMGKARFCSKACNGVYKRRRILRNCAYCGSEIEVVEWAAKKYSRSFCSDECRLKWQHRENNPNWNGGTSFEPYCFKFNPEFKNRVRAFFGYSCVMCGKPQIENGKRALAVHHVHHNKTACCDDSVKEFVVLCDVCHGKSNSGKFDYQNYFHEIIHTKYGGKCYYTKEEMKNLEVKHQMDK